MSLLKLRHRLQTVKSLSSIFSALQVVTVVRTQKTRQAYSSINKYLSAMKGALSGRIHPSTLPEKVLVVITSNRGLCGNFNQAVVSVVDQFLKTYPTTRLVLIGKTGYNLLRGKTKKLLFSEADVIEKPNFNSAARLFKRIYEINAEIYLAFNVYKSALVQEPKIKRLYPLPEELVAADKTTDLILEPNPALLVEKLFYHYLETLFFQSLLNSYMGELAARFMVLKGAVDNSHDIIDDLTLSINKSRQADITKDLLEIVSAAEAMRRDYE